MADIQGILDAVKLTDIEYFTLSEEKEDSLIYQLLDFERFDSLLLNAPLHIDISKEDAFPLMKIIQNDDFREWQVQESRNLVVVAYNLLTGKVIAKTARKDEKKRIYPPKNERDGPFPEDISITGYNTGCEIINIKHSLNIPWHPSKYRITILCFDWVSNTVDVVLHDKDKQPKINLVLPQSNDRKVDALLSATKNAGKGDVTFSVPEKCNADPQNFFIQGNFTIPVTAHNVTELDKKKSVIIPVWLMIVEKNIDQGSAILAKWFITAHPTENTTEQATAEGIFKFSLPELLPGITEDPLAPNDYCCYVVINGHVFGPEKCRITN